MRPECHCPVCGGILPAIPLTLLPERGMAVANGAFAHLTGKEAAVMEALIEAYPNVVSKQRIMQALYSLMQEEPEIKIVDVFVCKIRKKIAPLGVHIETAWGEGYSLGVLPEKPLIARAAS